jgi:hypothetical protein
VPDVTNDRQALDRRAHEPGERALRMAGDNFRAPAAERGDAPSGARALISPHQAAKRAAATIAST